MMEEKGEGEEYPCLWIHPLVKVFSAGEKVGDGVRVSRNVL
jgi:hypothetical protein